jgi:hypothetical protein
LVLWLNQVTRRFCGEPPQTPRADSGRELLPCTSSCPRLCLDFFATMRPALDPAGHLVTRADPTCLSTPRGPARHRPCMSALPLHQRKSRRNLHLQYSAKSQSTPHCQSLLTASSDHPPVLGRSCPQRERERERERERSWSKSITSLKQGSQHLAKLKSKTSNVCLGFPITIC